MTLNFNILTLFPEMFPGALGHSLAGRALERGDWAYRAVNIRDFGEGPHKTVDDTPYGGGAGMVMRADVIERALLSLRTSEFQNLRISEQSTSEILRFRDSDPLIYLSPRGVPLTQAKVKNLAEAENITLLCGRYEGVDQRVLEAYNFEEISVGDYVLSGGEPAALILMDACIRLLPGVMGNSETAEEESFSKQTGGLLEYPHYTKPASWSPQDGAPMQVPEVLTSGNHGKIKDWRREQAIQITRARRPDLLKTKI